jgi:hypothetical protein
LPVARPTKETLTKPLARRAPGGGSERISGLHHHTRRFRSDQLRGHPPWGTPTAAGSWRSSSPSSSRRSASSSDSAAAA